MTRIRYTVQIPLRFDIGKIFILPITTDYNIVITIDATSLGSVPTTLTNDPFESTIISIPDDIKFVTAGTCKDSAH